MSEDGQGQPWGACAAYGCPLAGSMGSGGQWWCFCHYEQPSGLNAPITEALRANGLICRLSLAIRGRDREGISLCRQELKGHQLGSELDFDSEKDKNAYGWKLRLERHLIELTAARVNRRRHEPAISTATVIGPTHAMKHYQEKE